MVAASSGARALGSQDGNAMAAASGGCPASLDSWDRSAMVAALRGAPAALGS